tara:strand:+ start:1397 stop:2476 length:1080 start_codon:yes stop_codon:yes gene_type:complete
MKIAFSILFIYLHPNMLSFLYSIDLKLITITLLRNKRIFQKNLGTMANRDLLKEAIADAKAVKEVAIANAKAALEEAFTPHLKNMLSEKINEMDKDEDSDLSEVDKDKKANREMETEGKDEELDLDELLSELELDDDSEESEVETTDVDDLDVDGEDLGDSDEEIDLDEMSEDELKTMIEDVIGDMVETGELEAGGDPVEMSDEETEEVEDEDVDVDVEVGEEEVDGEEEMAIDEKADLEKDLKEAKKVIKYLRSEINEVNLLNSKLLYTNKIFKAKNLNENQKIKVLKAFDKAETVKEAKRIFETLNENLVAKSTKSNIRESMGAASKSAGIAPRRKSTNIIPEDAMVSRFKQLAGIK